mgnify:CR=1 FL=1
MNGGLIIFYKKTNLGKFTEKLVIQACEVYAAERVANIDKISTPLKIIGSYDTYLLAVPEKKSTIDFMGEYKGIPFAMEVKETSNKTTYPLDPWDREQHQRDFLSRWNGYAYYLIGFWKLNEFYLLSAADYEKVFVNATISRKKSIKIAWFRDNARIISFKKGFLDFLGVTNSCDQRKVAL